jgi:hypothetical protein
LVSLNIDTGTANGEQQGVGTVDLTFDSTQQQAFILAKSLDAAVGVTNIDLAPAIDRPSKPALDLRTAR